jgi:Icc-related predicted phosphoesterase
MKILALSDIEDERVYAEGFKESYSDIDLIIGCGDLTYDYLEYVVTLLNRPLLYVHGNHDPEFQLRADGSQATGAEGCELIDDRVMRESGCLFMGLGGSIRYRPGAPFQYTEAQMQMRILKLTPRLLINRFRHGRFVDVVVAHSPPLGIHDGHDPAHTGFKAFLNLIRRFKPQLFLHGHVHGHEPRQSLLGDTRIIDVNPMRKIEMSNFDGAQ